ncbi:hypothetical protein SLA2020_412150 [Shorea laevis]
MEVNLPEIVQRILDLVEESNQVDLFKILNLESPEEEQGEVEMSSHIIPLIINSAVYMQHLKSMVLQGKLEKIHLFIKVHWSLMTQLERDFEILVLPYHFPMARFLPWHNPSPMPVMNRWLARLVLGPQPSEDWIMRIISWNCRGAAKSNFCKGAMDLKRIHNPSMMLILETKLTTQDARDQAASLGFPKSCIVDSKGLRGGLWLLWDDSMVNVDVVSHGSQAIHAVVQVCNNPLFHSNWFFSGIYCRPPFEIRTLFWQELKSMANIISIPWMNIGDFNHILDQSEKFGGNPPSQTRMEAYLNCMNACNMIDLGFIGNRFTWINCKFSSQLIKERLDRA